MLCPLRSALSSATMLSPSHCLRAGMDCLLRLLASHVPILTHCYRDVQHHHRCWCSAPQSTLCSVRPCAQKWRPSCPHKLFQASFSRGPLPHPSTSLPTAQSLKTHPQTWGYRMHTVSGQSHWPSSSYRRFYRGRCKRLIFDFGKQKWPLPLQMRVTIVRKLSSARSGWAEWLGQGLGILVLVGGQWGCSATLVVSTSSSLEFENCLSRLLLLFVVVVVVVAAENSLSCKKVVRNYRSSSFLLLFYENTLIAQDNGLDKRLKKGLR